MPKVIIKFDLRKDAWNWWEACNKISHNVDWKMHVSPELRELVVGKTEEEAYNLILPYLKIVYQKIDIDLFIKNLQEGFDQKSNIIFQRMKELTKHPIYRNDFICFITCFPRFPYDYDKGYVWLSYKKPLDYQLQIFIHELLHFQYFAYYGERIWDILGREKHATLKEAMTVILDDEFKDITPTPDEGYNEDEELRKKLLIIWKQVRDMDLFMNRAIEILR